MPGPFPFPVDRKHFIGIALQDLKAAMANSCNNAFVDIGMKLDISAYRKTAVSLLYNKDLPITFEYSSVPDFLPSAAIAIGSPVSYLIRYA